MRLAFIFCVSAAAALFSSDKEVRVAGNFAPFICSFMAAAHYLQFSAAAPVISRVLLANALKQAR